MTHKEISLKIYEFTLLQLIRGKEIVIDQPEERWHLTLDDTIDWNLVMKEIKRLRKSK